MGKLNLSILMMAISLLAVAKTANNVYRMPNTGNVAGWGPLDLSKSGTVGSSVLGVANGGTGQTIFSSSGLIVYNGSSLISWTLQSQTFSGNGTWTSGAGVTQAVVCGRGGSGGGGGANNSGGGDGGGGAATVCTQVVVTPSTGYGVTIGAAGTGGAASNNGNDGGDTIFGSLVTFKGAKGGTQTLGSVPDTSYFALHGTGIGGGGHGGIGGPSGGVAGTAGQNSTFASGGAGGSGIISGMGGGGGGAGDGAGGAGQDGNGVGGPFNGNPGTNGGGGGGGSHQNAGGAGRGTGGNGTDGQLVVYWIGP